MVSFLESVVFTVGAALLAACWHSLSRNGKPEAQELAVGFDLLVSAMVLQAGFLPGSQGDVLGFRTISLVLVFFMLTAMAMAMRMRGYGKSEELFRRHGPASHRRYEPVERMTGKAAWLTSIAGAVVLCAFWWLNMHMELVVTAWRGALH